MGLAGRRLGGGLPSLTKQGPGGDNAATTDMCDACDRPKVRPRSSLQEFEFLSVCLFFLPLGISLSGFGMRDGFFFSHSRIQDPWGFYWRRRLLDARSQAVARG